MATTTLSKKTDEIAALEKAEKQLKAAKEKGNELAIKKLKAKVASLKKGIKEGKTVKDVTAKQLANSLLASRKKFLEMSKKDFNGVLKQLAKKPEYAFLKDYTREEVVRDIMRKAKPVGWRFKGRGDYRKPTPAQVRKGRANGTVYYENRPNRSDVSQTKQLAKGGYANTDKPKHVIHVGEDTWYLEKIDSTHFYMSNSPDFRGMAHHVGQHKGEPYYEEVREWLKTTSMAKGGSMKGMSLPYCIYVTNLNNPNENSELVAKVRREGDARLILSELNKSLHKDTPLVYTMSKNKYDDGGFVPMSMAELERKRMSEYENYGGEGSEEDLDDGVTRQYFEDEAYSYEDGGEIDINDLDIPVHYTMFEDEMYEYAQGGNLPRRTISNVTYKVIKDGNGYNVGVFHTGGSAWKVGKPTSKSEAVKLLNMLVKDKSKRTRN